MPGVNQPTDTDFEYTLADLAHAQLRDKAPALLDYLLGFQVIDSNEDQTHGVGVLGFKIGEQIIFVPSFFLNGELKQNLIYLKNQDMFVPLQDNWVTYLLNRRPFVMGEAEHREEQELGVQQPDLTALSNTRTGGSSNALFGTRFASFEPWAQDAVAMFRKLGDRNIPTLPEFLKKTANYGTSRALAQTMRQDLNFANEVLRFHNLDTLLHAQTPIKKKASAPKGWKAPNYVKRSSILHDPNAIIEKSGSHRVNFYDNSNAPSFMTDADRESMLRNGYVIKDAREDANVAYEEDSNPRLQNPVDTGHHRLLVADGEFRDVCIGIAPKALGRGQVQVALVVDKETGDFGYWWPEQLWVDPKTDLPKEDDDGYFNKLPGIESVKPNQVYAIITPRRRMSVAFKVVAKNRTKNGTLELSVQPIVGDPGIKPSGTLPYRDGDLSQFGEGPHLPFVGEGVGKSEIPTASQDLADGSADTDDATYTNLSHIVVQKNSHKMSIVRKSLFVPDNAKVIKLSGGKSLQTWAMADPASLSDVASGFLKTNCERVRFLKNSGQVYINDTGPFDRVSAIKNLVKNVGLREKQAVHIVDRLKDGKRSSVLVKNNVGFAPGFPEQEMGYDNYADVPVQFQQDEEVPVDMPMGPFSQ